MIITDGQKLTNILEQLDEFAFDTETDGVAPHKRPEVKTQAFVLDRAFLNTFSLCGRIDGKLVSCAVPLSDKFGEGYLSTQELTGILKPFMENSSIKKIAHNMNYDKNVMLNHGVNVVNTYCTAVAAKCQDLESEAALKARATQVGMILRPYKNVDPSDTKRFSDYAEDDAVASFLLYEAYEGKNKKFAHLAIDDRKRKAFELIDLPLIDVVVDIERHGMLVDIPRFEKIYNDLIVKRETAKERIFKEAGEPFNINSSQQRQDVLYNKMGIQPPEGSETKSGYSTDAETCARILETGDVPIVQYLLDYAAVNKTIGTVDPESGIPAYADSSGYIHTTLSFSITKTGRFSSSRPNLQNVPNRKDVYGIRKAFIAPKGHKIIAADFKGMELAAVANICNVQVMLDALSDPKGDLHQATADSLSNDIFGEEGKVSRDLAKTLNFGLMYGMGPKKLCKELRQEGYDVDEEESARYHKAFWSIYPEVVEFKNLLVHKYRKDGFLTYLSGRRVKVKQMDSNNFYQRSLGERQLFNWLIQGSCADIVKRVMIKAQSDDFLKRLKYHTILQVHDELVGYCPSFPPTLTKVEKCLQDLFEEDDGFLNIKLKVPFRAEIGHGDNWAVAH